MKIKIIYNHKITNVQKVNKGKMQIKHIPSNYYPMGYINLLV